LLTTFFLAGFLDDSAQHGDENENATMAAGVRDLTHGDENENATMAAGDRALTHPDDKMTAAGDSLFLYLPLSITSLIQMLNGTVFFHSFDCMIALDQGLLHLADCVFNEHLQPIGQQGIRRGTMGHGLERMSRARRGKLQVVINEGSIRPVVPLVAAKWATECNIAVRTHVPILKHWKEYKDKPAYLELFMGCLKVSTFSDPLPPVYFRLFIFRYVISSL
jgi:hypothetical protein